MPTYREFCEQIKRRQRKRMVRRGMIVLLAMLCVLVAAVAVIKIWAQKQSAEVQTQTDSVLPQSTVQNDASVSEPTSDSQQAVELQAAWNVSYPLEKTLDQTIYMPDFRMLALPENGQVDMKYFDRTAILGDSVSQGWNVFNTSDMKEHAFICAYKSIGPSQVVNNQIADPGAGSGREQEPIFDTIINSKPKRLYILLGTNALVRNDETSELSYLAYYGQMLDKFREALGSEVAIYVQSVTPVRPGVSQPGLYKERIQRVNNKLAQMAVEKGCYFINLHEILADENGDLRADLAAADGVHLNQTAYPLIQDYLTTHTAYHPENPYLPGSPYYKAPTE